MIRLVLYILLIYLAYRLVKSFAGSLFQPGERRDDTPRADTDLIQDPYCGAYFLKQTGVKADIDGKPTYFCSATCRDAYLLKHQGRQ
ncbi:hypothetical protein [Desulfoferrobacter suflitae]|uniref:hypothetical protein n=1 Tax=Desulfoferrobacter suflitae TaxID=2865782 RepID=UPI002164A8A4|nr:hypothetical protein [Desulfoferrobacter suflitae]MCK8601312.1 hypothetical protein [Desulfoferrobacter suflitae]